MRLGRHQTVDEVHHCLQEQLTTLGMSISRREILYLFDAYCTLLRAGTEAQKDPQWLEHVKENKGIIVSMDGIQEDSGK